MKKEWAAAVNTQIKEFKKVAIRKLRSSFDSLGTTFLTCLVSSARPLGANTPPGSPAPTSKLAASPPAITSVKSVSSFYLCVDFPAGLLPKFRQEICRQTRAPIFDQRPRDLAESQLSLLCIALTQHLQLIMDTFQCLPARLPYTTWARRLMQFTVRQFPPGQIDLPLPVVRIHPILLRPLPTL